jgi:lipid A 3-O-deacylase
VVSSDARARLRSNQISPGLWTRAQRFARAVVAVGIALALATLPIDASATGSPVPTREPFSPGSIDSIGIVTFQWENDWFGGQGTDRHYTQGLRLAYLGAEDRLWTGVARVARALPPFPDSGRFRPSFALGQNLYTPEDIKTVDLVVDDRPYAGWLYAAIGLVADNGATLDFLELSVGVIGPAALGEETQSWIHRVIGSPHPEGWHHQLGNELAVLVSYDKKWRAKLAFPEPPLLRRVGLSADVTPHLGGALGNVFIHASAGAMLRIGRDLPADYGPPRISPSLPGSEFFVPSHRVGGYLFVGADGRFVAHNMFLDGNTFADSHRVDKKPVVGDLQAGAVLILERVRLGFTYVLRSEEFTLQRGGDRFGALTISVRI